jgi:hypothetical protein
MMQQSAVHRGGLLAVEAWSVGSSGIPPDEPGERGGAFPASILRVARLPAPGLNLRLKSTNNHDKRRTTANPCDKRRTMAILGESRRSRRGGRGKSSLFVLFLSRRAGCCRSSAPGRVARVPGEVSTTTEDGWPRCLAFGHLGEDRPRQGRFSAFLTSVVIRCKFSIDAERTHPIRTHGGFYKRGCQVKTLLLIRRGRIFF